MIQNRKASYEYSLLDPYTAGIVLIGSEVKSIRKGDANINDAYCVMMNGELFIRNMHVEQYKDCRTLHEVRRDRKLLLKRTELRKIGQWLMDKGVTAVPLRVRNEGRVIKVDIAVAKGKKLYDKRETIKEREYKRSLQREAH